MKNKKIKMFFISLLCVFIYHGNVLLNAKALPKEEITDEYVEEFKKNSPYNFKIYIVHFSAIIYEVNGKKVKIPVFRGTKGDVLHSDLLSYFRYLSNISFTEISETGYAIKTKKGEAKKTLHEFLAFYKSNILKDVDIEHPVTIYLSPVEWILQYNFVVDGVPCYMHINFESRKEDYGKPLPKSVYEIVPNENAGNPGIFFMFYRGRSVPQ